MYVYIYIFTRAQQELLYTHTFNHTNWFIIWSDIIYIYIYKYTYQWVNQKIMQSTWIVCMSIYIYTHLHCIQCESDTINPYRLMIA